MYQNSSPQKVQLQINPFIEGFNKGQKQRQRKSQMYVKQLKQQIENQRLIKAKQQENRKLEQKRLDDKVKKELLELEDSRVKERSLTDKKKSKFEKSVEPIKMASEKIVYQPSVLQAKSALKQWQYSPIMELSQKVSLKQSYSSQYPRLQFQNISSSIKSNIGYLKAKQSLEQQRFKLSRLRSQMAYPSKRTFVRSAQSALQNLKLITAQTKANSKTLPFILPQTQPQYSSRLDSPIQFIPQQIKRFHDSSMSKTRAQMKNNFSISPNQGSQLFGAHEFKY